MNCQVYKWAIMTWIAAGIVLAPTTVMAQGIADSVQNFHKTLESLFVEMLPLAKQLTTVARSIAGFGALWFIASRVWGHMARAEPIDVYPLLRPFAIGLLILFFPTIIAVIHTVGDLLVDGTASMVHDSNAAINKHIDILNKQDLSSHVSPPSNLGDPDQYSYPGSVEDTGIWERLANSIYAFNLQNILNQIVSGILQVLFFAASLCINTIRTFQLLVLTILGPIVLGLSVYDGFQHTLSAWFARYINVFMWLPVANIFGAVIAKIQLNLMELDQNFLSSTTYMVFMVIAIVGYFTVPNVASYIVQPGGRDQLLNKTNNIAKQGAQAAVKVGGAVAKSL
ncbi:conjugative transposon protein TraJ [Echinicola sp. 20G]|uniref:conjugative transposon protein TraJ n=1 Tax=Echinicola sp. 20G TaxID=2781961 RepID=UPI00191098E0|nr:conjugative transposon protein TraJ [Echinicola sp. 20G]